MNYLTYLLVDETSERRGVTLDLLLLEPERDLALSRLDRVGAVAHVAADVEGEVTTDGARGRGQGVGGTEDGAASLDDVLALPNGGNNGAGEHVLEQAGEERLGLQVLVVLTEELLRGREHLEGDQLEATVLETAEDAADKATLDAVRLDHDEALLSVRHFC